MKPSVFDLHCDTAYEMHRRGEHLTDNTLAVSLSHARVYSHYTQVLAIWTDARLSDEEGWDAFWKILSHLTADPALTRGDARLVTSLPMEESDTPLFLLSVEDARILGGKLSRVDALYEAGVRVLTPLWGGVTCMGGSHDTSEGLSPFGKAAVRRAVECGMLLDLSHASIRAAAELQEISQELGRPVIASHSNAYAVCPVSRNLRDDQIHGLIQCDGLIGLNFHAPFLSPEHASAETLLFHIDHFLSLGAERQLALGGDLDGSEPPKDLETLAHLGELYELLLRHNYREELANRIFYGNAHRFWSTYLTEHHKKGIATE